MKQILSKALFSLVIVAVLTVGFFAAPAEAVANQCQSSMFGCSFSHVSIHNDGACAIACCEYECPDGSQIQGICWYA